MKKLKIDKMHHIYGLIEDKKCKDCKNLQTFKYHGKTYRKCAAYGISQSVATDWALKYTACGLFNKDYTRTAFNEKIDEPHENQIFIFE